MSFNISWIIQLKNEFSREAKKINANLKKMRKEGKKTERSMSKSFKKN